MKTASSSNSQLSAVEELLLTQKMMRMYYWKVFFNPAERRDTRDLLIMLKAKVRKATAQKTLS
jgi:hypothetical protein